MTIPRLTNAVKRGGFVMASPKQDISPKTIERRREIARKEVKSVLVSNILAGIQNSFDRNRVRSHFLNGLLDLQDLKDGVFQ